MLHLSLRIGLVAALLVVGPGLGRDCRGAEPAVWVDQRQARPFVCRANYELGRDPVLLRELQALRIDVAQMLGLNLSAEPVEVYLFRDKSSYKSYLQEKFPSVPLRRALFIKGAGPGMVYAYDSRDFAVDLRHEVTHAVLHTVFPEVPLWLDEGLAEYFEAPRDERASGHPHLANVQWNLWLEVKPLAELEAKRELTEMSRRDYRDAWAWVHFLLHGPQPARDELRAYLADLKAGRPTAPLGDRLTLRLAAVEEQLVAHLRGWE